MQREQISAPFSVAAPSAQRRRPRRRLPIVIVAILLLIAGLAGWTRIDPAFIPDAVDLAREVVGPAPVGQVEAWAFQAQDSLRRLRYQATGSAPAVRWAAPPIALPRVQPAAPSPGAAAGQARSALSAPVAPAAPADASPGTTAADNLWSPFVYDADGRPVLERAIVAPDPTRPYVQTALVRIDLRYARIQLVAGTREPQSPARVRRPGAIPASDQQSGRLLAAFNGGFKAINGGFGIAVSGVTLLRPTAGLATLALYRDGSLRLGSWGADITATPDLAAYRQNCPLLLDGGRLTAQATTDNAALWGRTIGNKVATWRSGLGLSADGRYLTYAVGDGLTVPALGQALIQGGADRAMQLDINAYWTRFVTYAPVNGRLVAQKLLAQMAGDARQFLAPDSRDFFYVTAK